MVKQQNDYIIESQGHDFRPPPPPPDRPPPDRPARTRFAPDRRRVPPTLSAGALQISFCMGRGYPESVQSTDDLSTRLKDLIVDSAPPEFIYDDSSFGYDPSDDTSETSSAFNQDPYKKRDPAKFNYSRPRLIRLSADFPGVRNLEKMRRKRQSMGSSSTGSMSSPSPSPRSAGEYGFFVALTSKDQIPQQRHGRYYSMT